MYFLCKLAVRLQMFHVSFYANVLVPCQACMFVRQMAPVLLLFPLLIFCPHTKHNHVINFVNYHTIGYFKSFTTCYFAVKIKLSYGTCKSVKQMEFLVTGSPLILKPILGIYPVKIPDNCSLFCLKSIENKQKNKSYKLLCYINQQT